MKQEIENLKKTIKQTKIHEISNENKVLFDELGKLKALCEFYIQQNTNNERNLREFSQVKENLSRQDYIIITLQEGLKKLQEDLFYLY